MGLGNFDDWEAEQQESNTGIFGDSIDMLQSGAIDTVAGVAEFAGAENLSDSLNDWSQEQFNTLSPEGKSAMSKQLINDDLSIGEGAKDPRTWWLNSMNVLGGMAVTMFPAGAAGKAASLAGQGSRIAANSGKVSVGVNALLNGAAGNGISARGVQDDINNLSFDDLKDSPRFKNIAQTHISNGDQPLEAMTKAREELATAAGDELSGDFSLFALNSVLDGVGDKGFSKLIKGSLGKTVKGALAKGVASEAGTEAAQGYGETVLTNQAREEQTNEGRDLTEGAAANALTGAALGAVIGGVPAPIGAQVGKVRRRNFESKIESVVNPETVTKMRSQGYNDTDIRRVLSEGVSNQALGLGFEPSEAKQLSDQAIDFALGNTPSANQRHAVEDEAAQGQPNEQPQQQNATQAQESAPLTWSEENGYPDPSEFGLSEQDAELIIDPPPELLSAQGTINPKAPKALKQAYQIAMGRAESSEYHKAVFNNSAPEREQSQQAWNQEAQQNLNWQQQQNPETVEQDQNALAESIRAGDLSFVDNAARNDQQFANGLRTAMDISPSAVLQIAQMRRSGEMNENQALSALQRVINSVNNFDDSLDATPEELDLRTRSNQQRAQQDFENMPDEQRRQEIQARLLQGRQEQQQTNSAQGQERPNGERDVTPVNTGIENQRVDNAPRVEFDRWSDVVSGDQDIDQRDYNSPFGDYREAQVMEQDTIHQPRETAERQPSTEPTTQDQVDQFRGQSAGVLQGNLSGVNPKANQRSQKKQGKKVAEGKRAIAARLNAQQEANAPQDHSTEYQPNNALADAFESAKQPEPQPEPEPEVKPESKAPKAKTTQTKIGDGVNATETKDGKAWRYSREGVRTQVSITVQSDRGFVELISGGVRKRFYYGKKGADKGVSSESLINNEIQAGSFDNAKKLANKAINEQLDTNATAQTKAEETLAEVKATSRTKAAGGRLAELQGEREVIAAAVKAHEDMEERDAVEDKDPTLAQKKAILAGVDTFGAASKAYGGMDGLFRAGRPLKLRLASLDTEIGKLQDTEVPSKAEQEEATVTPEKTPEKQAEVKKVSAHDVDLELPAISKEMENDYNRGSHLGRGRDFNQEMNDSATSILDSLLKKDLLNTPERRAKAKEAIEAYFKKNADFIAWETAHAIKNPSWHVTGRSNRNMDKYNKAQNKHMSAFSAKVDQLAAMKKSIEGRVESVMNSEQKASKEEQGKENLKKRMESEIIGYLVRDIFNYMQDGKPETAKDNRKWALKKAKKSLETLVYNDKPRALKLINAIDSKVKKESKDKWGIMAVVGGKRSAIGKYIDEIITSKDKDEDQRARDDEEPTPPEPTPPKKKAPTKKVETTVKGLSDFSSAVAAVNPAVKGELSFDEYKAVLASLVASESDIKAGIYDSPVVKRKRKEDVKDSLVKQNFNRLVYGMLQAISPNYGSYEGLDVFSKRSTLEQLEDRVSALTEETYNTNVANRKEQRAKSESDEKARKAGIENPETRADFMRLASSKDVSLNNIATILDDEQLAQFDTLAAQAFAEKQENQFQRELERRGTIQAVEGTDSVGHETEMSTFDSGSPSYVVRLTDRIGKEKWKELAQAARKIDSGVKVANARYAKSVGKPEGWHFTSPEAQNQFVALLGGEEVNATENLTAQAEKKANSAKEKQVNKLKSLSESQDAKAEEVINQDRKTNTAKRAGDAARVLERAYGQQENARILGKIAEGVESGDISVLGNLQDLTQLETLEYLTRRLLWNMSESDRDKFAKRDSMGRWFLNSDVTIDQIVRFARFPDPEMHVNNLNGLARDMAVVKGYLNTGKFIAKQVENHSGDNLITMTGPVWNKHIAKIRAFAKIKNYGAADLANELFKTEGRLNRMGIVDNATLREALRELDAVSKEITTSKPKETPVSRLTDAIEQKVRASNKAYIDFFPTDNNELAENVIDSADIQEGMKVLEPSAGMGDLADRIAAKGADLDVGDISSDMRELLEAKGHNVIGDNFLEMESAPIYDRIVMNPPFHNDSAITHINHALSMLKDGGRLVAITPINTGDKGNSKNKNFREYLDAVGAVEENNPSGSFKNSLNSTGVETKTIVIDKPENSADLPPPDDIRFSQTSVGADTKSAGVTVRKVMNEADKFISGYEGMKGINVTVVETQDQLSDFTATEPNTKVKGVWLSGDNRVVLVADNLANAQEVRSVLRHELIAHNGLYANLSPKEIETLTKKINALRGNAKVKPLFDEVDKAYKGAPDEVKAEEVIARLAEKESGKLKQIADRVLAFVMGALRRSGVLSQDKATLAEIRTMINNTDNYLRDNKGQLRSPGVIRFSQTIAKEDAEQVDYGDPKMSYAEAVEIQADTFLKQILGKVPSKLKSTALYDAMKGNGWGLLTLRQLAEVAKAKVSPNYSNLLDQYVTTVNTKMARQNALLEDVTDLSEDIRQWIRKGNKDKADELFTFMHESTLENVDPSREYQDLTDLLTDMIGIKEQQIKGRSGESNKQLFDELKQYKKDLKGEMYRRKAHAKMKVIYDRMTDEQKDLFGRVRDHYEKQQDDMFTALVDRAAKLSLTGTGSSSSKQALNIHARLIKEFGKTHAAELGKLGSSEIALELAIAKKGYYVPLARFGKYWVSTKWEAGSKKPNGEVELDSQFEMFESEEEMNARVKQLTAAGFKPKFGKNIEESGMVSGATMSFVTDVMDKINEAKAQNEVKDQLKDDLYQMFLQALPDRSIRKSFIHRKGTKGYSDNALRALADQGFKQSRQQARLETEDDLQAILTGVNDMAKSETNNVSAQRIADEMNKRHEWVMNPKRAKWAQKLTGIGFFMLIGASPASALMNITQNIQVAIPVIGSKYGYAATASEMGKLTKLWVTNRYAASKDQKTKNRFGVLGSILEGDEREAMRRAVEQGTIDVTQTSDALGLAEEPDAQIGDWKDRVNRTLGWSFHNAEVLNREVTFMTAYRLAKRDGLGNEAAYHYATKATWDSHFDYGSLNRARFMQGDVATVAMQFKQYSQNMSYYLIHNTLKALGKGNPTPEQKAEARKQIMGTMALTFAMGGLSAMPLATLAAIANMVHSAISDEYDPWDAETELNGILTEWFGAEWAKTLYNGLPPEVGLPSIGSRINIDFMGMWVRQSDAENASGTVADIGEQFFGPIGGIITNGARGFDYMGQGRLYRGTEMFMPKWIKDIVKTARYSAEGGNVTNRNGEVMVGDLTGVEYAGQLLGFTPTRLSEQYDTNSRIKKYENKIKMHRKILMNQMWVSYMKKDQEEIRNIWKSIKEYNRSDWGKVNPITSDAVKTSLQGHLRMQQKAVNGLHYNPKFEQLVRNKFLQE
ncbi:PLxRFG domain-containing protein [Vibrio splendidus]